MKRCAFISAALGVAVGTLAPHVAVASDASPVVVAYRAPAFCPNAQVFRQHLQRRLPSGSSVQVVNPDARVPAGALLLQVEVEANGDSFAAQISLRGPYGQSSPRRLTGPKCVDLIEALAFTGALSVEQAQEVSTAPADSTGRGDEPTATLSDPTSAPDSPTTLPDGKTAGRVTEAESNNPTTHTPSSSLSEEYDGERARLNTGSMTWTSQASAGVTFTSPLDTSLNPGLAVGLQFNATSATGWSPALGLNVQGSFQPLQVTSENASFVVLTGQVYLCPGALSSEAWTVRLCGVFQLGAIRGRGENLDLEKSVNARLSSAGPVLTASYLLSNQLFVGGQLGALMALDQHRFEIGTERRVIAETRTVAPWLALELGTML